MSTLSWNCRGLGNPRTVHEVLDLVSRKKPEFVFLMETKVGRSHAERLRIKLGFEGLFYVNSVCLSGGLALFWRKNNTARLLSFSKNHVDVEVSMAGLGSWRMTGFYGFPERARRSASWDLLRSLVDRSTLPWVVLGDFNDLLFQHEKRGGNPHPDSLLRGFGEAVDECRLTQLPMQGYQFTWERGNGTLDWMEERLDKVLARADWCEALPDATVTNLLTRSSDHSALFLGVKEDRQGWGGSRKNFKFEMAWIHDEGCRKQVEEAWLEGVGEGLLGRLQHCGEYQRIEAELCRLETQEEEFWRQRAKQHWLRGADANTKFFHRYDSSRKKKNTISRLKNESDVWVEGDELHTVVLDYFHDIFAPNVPSSSTIDSFVASIAPRVSQHQNEALLRSFVVDEVKTALFSMFPDKAPGPDGMNPGFYQHYWDVVGSDVSTFVLKCLNECFFPTGLNDTNVVLIPKKACPERVSDLRPIALCNVVYYKIMAKMVANRMKPLLGEVISDSQSAFIPNRLITYNILIAAEVGHYLNRKQCGMVGWGALKLDMAKAYDRMEWPYLRKMLLAGQAESRRAFYGCRVARGAPSISHLFFADDSLLFFKATVQEAGVIKQCLVDYENMSGQAVNFHKSSVCFSRNTSEDARDEVASVWELRKHEILVNTWASHPLLEGIKGQCSLMLRIKSSIELAHGTRSSFHRQDLRAFNLAMLGKQAWRFLTRPHSLVARIYKARYYPRTSFIDATVGNCPSFCWRSIMVAHELICSGVRRRVGDGKSTLIWGHPWLPDDPTPMVQTAMPPELNGSLVSGLINPSSGTWDDQILRDIFNPIDVERILQIPVSPHYEDSWFWLGDPKGSYSVKHGYRRMIGDFEIAPGNFDKWLHLWKIKCPAKWRTFVWRALSNTLPTTINLIIKRVEVDPSCPMCRISHENTMHSLVLCDYSKLIWHDFCLHIPSVNDNDFGVWFRKALTVLSEEDIIIAIAVMYHIWRARNMAVWSGALPLLHGVWRSAMAAVSAWRQVHGTLHHQQLPKVTSTRAEGALVHCYVDAGYKAHTRTATVGAILLAHDGGFLAAFNGILPACFSPLMAESLACKEALSWLKDRGLTSAHIYTDCSMLKDLLTTPQPTLLSYVSFSIDASRAIMSVFNTCSVNLVPRAANRAAHALVALAFSQENSLFWDSIPPDSISGLI
ncbi:uncharacterized protein LOC116024110 [Ipomoea triloba]|uniref:uncharacterized protein LOC116024110 n=1 Tax=Ipomoea triloba TaxID=35885 RepID=UPI00125D4C3D|nr:uncharacterized protein LOC116024110 [Ipomoea triloba]